MLQKLKNREAQAGFTLVELLIVIVVIAILAAIVITTFSGVQARARDAERQTDIKAIASQLEVYYTDKGNYLPLADMQSTTTATTTLKGLSPGALKDPTDTSTNSVQTAAPSTTNKRYQYVVPAGCATTTPTGCTSFTISYWNEADSSVKSTSGLSSP